jgi:predicted nucleic acid-binding protein
LITSGSNTEFVSLEQDMADKAAELRARYNIALADALQVAVAMITHCDALLTNDHALKRIAELDIVVLDDLSDA